MKHFTFRFLTLLLAVLCMGAALQAAAAGKKAPKNKAVYYLVCASFNTLEDAVKTSENMSEVLFYPVYKATVEGRTVYRLCCECYYSKEKAQKRCAELASMTFSNDIWVWKSNGLAQCVYVPQSPADEPGVESKPLVPQW